MKKCLECGMPFDDLCKESIESGTCEDCYDKRIEKESFQERIKALLADTDVANSVIASLQKENAELRKRLECPAVEWVDGCAFANGVRLGYVHGTSWAFLFDEYSFHLTSGDPQEKLKQAWAEFWQTTHGGVK